MVWKLSIPLTLFMLSALVIGCSAESSNPVASNNQQVEFQLPVMEGNASKVNHSPLSTGTIHFDLDNLTATVSYDRATDGHINVTPYVTPLDILVTFYDPVTCVVHVDITITNPYHITGSDVRLIIYNDSAGHLLLNSDDWTDLYDIPAGLPINPFIAYAKSEPQRVFEGTAHHTESLRILLPGGNPDVQYAVDASYPGNCAEPYQITNFVQFDELYDEVGATAELEVDVYDWMETVSEVFLYCPEITGVDLVPFYHIALVAWGLEIENSTGAPEGDYSAVVVAYTTTSGSLALYDFVNVTVTHNPIGWAKTWGGSGDDVSRDVAVDSRDRIFTVGYFEGTVDFDPGPDEFSISSNGSDDAFLNVFKPDGEFITALTWGSVQHESALTLAIDDEDSIYIAGCFYGPCDFDPGPGEYILVPESKSDAYLLKLDSKLEFVWAVSWGGDSWEHAWCLALDDSLNVYVAGYFCSTVDFDPGPDVVEYTSNGDWDCYVSKFDSSGDFIWANTWGSSLLDVACYIITEKDDRVFIVGTFKDIVDFAPGGDVDEHRSNGEDDVFLTVYKQDGRYISTQTWGGEGYDTGRCLDQDNDGYIYVGGNFSQTVDFNPGSGVDEHTSIAATDIFVSYFNSDMKYETVIIMGGTSSDNIVDMFVDNQRNLYITGPFWGNIDFDPSGGTEMYTSSGLCDSYIAKYQNFGKLLWVNVWGSPMGTYAYAIVLDSENFNYVAGLFGDTVDFYPGTGVDEHTTAGEHDAFLMKTTSDGEW